MSPQGLEFFSSLRYERVQVVRGAISRVPAPEMFFSPEGGITGFFSASRLPV